jgi:hypothetical protein
MAAAILGFLCSSVRTLGRITWLAWIGLPCILIAGMSAIPPRTYAVHLQVPSHDRHHRRCYPGSPGCCANH